MNAHEEFIINIAGFFAIVMFFFYFTLQYRIFRLFSIIITVKKVIK